MNKNTKKYLKVLLPLLFIILILVISNFFQLEKTFFDLKEDKSINTSFGDFDFLNTSLFILAFVIGLIDGFNPCAMWVLIYLITILTQLDSKKKMVYVCSIFLFASGVIYFIILLLWLLGFSLLALTSFSHYLILVVGAFSIWMGVYFIYEYINKKGELECKIGDIKSRKKTMSKIQKLVTSKITILSTLGIIVLAFTVNSVEFLCSAGLPAIFTQVLQVSDTLFITKLWYILVYIFAFMLDDLIIFILAIYALNTNFLNKYSGISHLIGGIFMFLIGIILIFFKNLLF
jgi:hypothetical protein